MTIMSNQTHVLEFNVGGVIYATSAATLCSFPNSLLSSLAAESKSEGTDGSDGTVVRDGQGRIFIDRDGVLFRFILDFLRNQKILLPEHFHERERLKQEAAYYRLPELVASMDSAPLRLTINTQPEERNRVGSSSELTSYLSEPPLTPGGSIGSGDRGYIIVGYRGTFTFGRGDCGGAADVKFRKLWRILVSGKVSLCREVFRDTLNESRDADRGTSDRYSARFFLKHSFLEQAFDALQECGFRMVGSAGSGTNSAGDLKPGMDAEENRWNHYNEFVFCR